MVTEDRWRDGELPCRRVGRRGASFQFNPCAFSSRAGQPSAFTAMLEGWGRLSCSHIWLFTVTFRLGKKQKGRKGASTFRFCCQGSKTGIGLLGLQEHPDSMRNCVRTRILLGGGSRGPCFLSNLESQKTSASSLKQASSFVAALEGRLQDQILRLWFRTATLAMCIFVTARWKGSVHQEALGVRGTKARSILQPSLQP